MFNRPGALLEATPCRLGAYLGRIARRQEAKPDHK